jgi:hypothetical protein
MGLEGVAEMTTNVTQRECLIPFLLLVCFILYSLLGGGAATAAFPPARILTTNKLFKKFRKFF